jgi:predicted nuclease of predicted toxin-antitoxin system
MRFLIDECLSVDLVSIARDVGHDAQHVARIGKAGWKDWNVARYAGDGDFVLVTNNASDFRRLYVIPAKPRAWMHYFLAAARRSQIQAMCEPAERP